MKSIFLPNLFMAFGIILLSVSSCTYENEEELYTVTGCQTDDMSYASDIEPILETNCYGCHAVGVSFGNITLEEYSNLSISVGNGALMGSINHIDGWSPMPQGAPMLLECQIEKVEAWISQGAKNN